ncbi:MAG: Gfo/Idh/MocA family oxidoreductase [Chloroflexi bacterium]|nr:Gfo/Idh/MocA family oxidoreductase [Chloroflexota bacterium]
MKFLIAGLGSIGRRHLRNLITLGEQNILLYRTHLSTLPDDELAPFRVEADLAVALAEQPDAVIVANPTALHLDVAIPAALAGCHLLIEKPVAQVLGPDIYKLETIVNTVGVRTLIGFQFRFHPVLTQVKTILDAGGIGRPLSFRAHWGEYLPEWHPWEDYRQSYAARADLGGGVTNTLCHPLDYLQWLFGEVNSLYAVTDRVSDLEIDVEDLAEITLRFANGVIGSLHLDYFQRPPAHWLEIAGTRGHIRWDNDTGTARVYYADKNRWSDVYPPVGFERNALFLAQMEHFIALIKDGGRSRCSLAEGIKTMELIDAVHASGLSHTEVQL